MNYPSDGFVAVVKRDCPTCSMVVPVLRDLVNRQVSLVTYTQDDPTFPADLPRVIDDTALERSFHWQIETVPTIMKIKNGRETGRIVGWHRQEWETFFDQRDLGQELIPMKPGCGAKNVEPGIAEELAILYGETGMTARHVRLGEFEDDIEACFARGWSDGLPVVPPTAVRVYRMLQGTTRRPDEIIGVMPPNLAQVNVEKVAVNAVMAGCKPEYMPVVLAAVEAACEDPFNMHGILATTYHVGPVVVVNGPVTERINMNSGINALGQGNRANATIGRALQLVVRNVGGGIPGEIDRAAQGNPGKYTFCFAEREHDTEWEPLAAQLGVESGKSAVTLFCGSGVYPIMDQISRTPESLARSFAMTLRTVCHAKYAIVADAMLAVSPEHTRVFEQAGWSKQRLLQELEQLLLMPTAPLARGVDGNDEGMPDFVLGAPALPKFRPGGLLIVRVGGSAGMFSSVIAGWPASGATGSVPVTREVRS